MNVWSKGKAVSIAVSDIKLLAFKSVTGVGETTNAKAIINAFELFQNYPNPFNPSTRIEYQIPSSGVVEIKIYSITGELVKTLAKSEQSAGKYSITWNGKDDYNKTVSSGVYICRVMFGNSVLSKKMLMLK